MSLIYISVQYSRIFAAKHPIDPDRLKQRRINVSVDAFEDTNVDTTFSNIALDTLKFRLSFDIRENVLFCKSTGIPEYKNE